MSDPEEPPISPEAREEPEAAPPEAEVPPAPTRAEPLPPPPPSAVSAPPALARSRPDLEADRRPVYRECSGYRLRLDPPDLARLRELPGSRGKSDEELGEAFFDGQASRLAASIAGDVPSSAEIRVVVDPYSRQAFLALENRIRGIVSF